jgi:hypothetical protein
MKLSWFDLGGIKWFYLASVKDNQTLCPFFVHDAMPALAASDGISWLHFIITMAF